MKTYYITPSKAVKWDETKQVYEGTMCPFWICSKEDEEGLLEFKWITHWGVGFRSFDPPPVHRNKAMTGSQK